jgi:hypothetical protein
MGSYLHIGEHNGRAKAEFRDGGACYHKGVICATSQVGAVLSLWCA